MSRIRLLAHNVSSGYVQLAANSVFTLLSIPLALHYLPKQEFGLWALASQVVGYLALLDLGMSGSIIRVLIDRKDHPHDGLYGSIIKTGSCVLVAQGLIIAALGVVLGLWLPDLLDVPAIYARPFRLIFVGHAALTGVLFFLRIFGCVLQAHQRLDVLNYSQAGYFAVNLAVLTLGFGQGWGLYSLLAAHAAGLLFAALILLAWTKRLRLFPPSGTWGRVNGSIFRELFLFGSDLFLMSVGLMLINQSQVAIITRTLGLETAAVWKVATTGFTMAQQIVARLWDSSANTISEMVVRDERARFRQRFADIFLITAAASVFVGLGVAVGNGALLELWTNGRIHWSPLNDALMAALLLTNCVTRLHVGLLGPTKKIGGMRYIYFLEGVSFVTLAFLVAPRWGMPGILVVALAMNMLWTGLYGTHRTAREFGVSFGEVAWSWLLPAWRYALLFTPVAALCHWLAQPLPATARLTVSVVVMGTVGVALFWTIGLTPALRDELRTGLAKLRARFKASDA